MKKRILALCLCGALLLSGCTAMLERGHETVTTHVDYAVTEDESILRAETYQGLVNAMLYFVNGHRMGGTIRLHNYTGDVEADLANARDEVMYEDPLGAFSVGELSYESTRILTYHEVELRIAYSRTFQEMERLREVTGLAGVRQELGRLVTGQEASAAFLASYFSGDRELAEQLLELACLSAPALYRHHGVGTVDISFYPETGTRRVVEVKLEWNRSIQTVTREEREYAQQLETAVSALLEANPPEGEGYTVEELAAIVRAASGEADERGSARALDALSGEASSDLGLLMAMEYLCQQCGVEVEPVSGSEGLWLIVGTAEGYRHLLPQGLYPPQVEEEPDEEEGEDPEPSPEPEPEPSPEPDPDSGEEEPAPPEKLLYTDQELIELGYEWPTALHPACEGAPEAQVDEAPEDGEPGDGEPEI